MLSLKLSPLVTCHSRRRAASQLHSNRASNMSSSTETNRRSSQSWRFPLSITVSLIIAACLAPLPCRAQHDPHHWPNRTGIVHLFEWPFEAVAAECEQFLAPAGYAAVQLSPVNEYAIAVGRAWWERYQPVSYSLERTRSGTGEQLRQTVQRCNRVGVRIYVDVVLNHMAAGGGWVNGTAGSTANVPARDYPAVPYQRSDFHRSCSIDSYNDAEQVRNCELVGLPDVNQTVLEVRDKQVRFLNALTQMGVAGFRVDAAKHMWPEDLREIYGRLVDLRVEEFGRDARPFIYQEVIDLGGEAVQKTEYNHMGLVTEFRHSMEIGRAFRGHNQLRWLRTWGEAWGFLPSIDALIFVDNHDNQRSGSDTILTYKQKREYRMATAFMLAHPFGVPRVMSSFAFDNKDQGPPADANGNIVPATYDAQSGQCNGGWVCEHRWPEMVGMIGFRNAVAGVHPINFWWDNGDNQIGFCRGHSGMVFFNNGNADLQRTFQTCLPRGVYCDVFGGQRLAEGRCSGTNVTVDARGEAFIEVSRDRGVLAVHLGSKI